MKNCRQIILLVTFFSLLSVAWSQCDDGYVEDCSGDGDCCNESWIGDGYCDNENQAWGCDLICYESEWSDCYHFPQIVIYPDELSATLEQGNSLTQILTIVNQGDETLDWSTYQDGIPGWLSLSTYSGSIETGSVNDITVTFDSSDFGVGEYNASIVISSNDPINGEISIPITMVVIIDGCNDGYTELDNNCYNNSDLDVLQQLIDSSIETINADLDDNNDGNIEPLEFGFQEWNDGRLTALECYYFENDWMSCNLSGQLISSIGNLDQLQRLILTNNQLSGELPPEIGNLSHLEILYLENNAITFIPPEISALGSLEYLLINYNELTSLPEDIGMLANLRSLSLNHNQLTEIPESIVELSNLSHLWLSGNDLTTIPENICDLNIEWGVMDCSFYPYFDISYNYICPPYPICDEVQITSEEFQETSECSECPDSIEGDTNFDDTVNILDIVIIANCILSDSCDICFDFNSDEVLNILDIVILVNIILDS